MAEKSKLNLKDALIKIHDATRSPNSHYCVVDCKSLVQELTCGGGILNKCGKGNYADKHIVITNCREIADECVNYKSSKFDV